MNKHTQRISRGIDRRAFIASGGASSVMLASGSLPAESQAGEDATPPNVLLIITDQQHVDTIAAGGCPYVNTPNLDRLKRRGASFVESYSANPVCSPARSAIFTGRATTETGVYINNKHIRPGMPNLGEWFSKHTNYETLYAGKWHVPRSHQNEIEGFTVLHTGIGGQGNIGDAGTSRACEAYLRNRSTDRPFLMVASFMQPHDVCEWLRINMENPQRPRYPELADELPPLPDNFRYDANEPEHLTKTRTRNEPAKGGWNQRHWRYYLWSYYRHVEMVDGEIGRILQALEDTGQDKNTLVMFTADHGEGLARHQMVRKSSPYDEASKVPLLISLPGRMLENRTDASHLVTGMDVVPTVCDYAGIEPPPDMRGKSLKPILEGRQTKWHDYVVTEMPGNRGRLVRTERYKYVTYAGDSTDQLFDMKGDPGETVNLAADPQQASVVAEHRQMLRDWERQLDTVADLAYADAWWYES